MDINSYCDGLLILIQSAGVNEAEIEAANTRQRLVRCFYKGVPFEVAARAICQLHCIEIEEGIEQ